MISLHANRRLPVAIVGGVSTVLLAIGPTAAVGDVESPTPPAAGSASVDVVSPPPTTPPDPEPTPDPAPTSAADPTPTGDPATTLDPTPDPPPDPTPAAGPGRTSAAEQAPAVDEDALPAVEQITDAALTVDGGGEQAPAGFVPAGPVVEWSSAEAVAVDDRVVAALGSSEPIVLAGRGNGHGIGMSQYGAQGQALKGRNAGEILRHYFRGASIGTSTVGFEPRIGVLLDSSATRLVVRGGDARIRYASHARTARAGDVWEVRVNNSTGRCRVTGPGGNSFEHDPGRRPCLTADPVADNSSARIEVQRPSNGSFVRDMQYGRKARVEVIPDRVQGVWRVDVVVELPLEQYLYGLAEMPYSWDLNALRTQAIAGRSYALWRLKQVGDDADDLRARGCSCHLYDSQQDQVYAGWDRERSGSWSRWKTAVDSTRDMIVTARGQIGTVGGVVQTFYSSSSNGRTESKHELWGGSTYPYLVSVDDRWSLDPATGNPHRNWQKELSRSSLASRVGLDQLSAVEVADRSTSGATTRVRFLGVDNGRRTSVTTSGSWMRSSFGLRSTTFTPIDGNDFADIGGSPHEADIRWIAERGITTGCDGSGILFCPQGTVTRGQMAAFLTRAFSLPSGRRVFADTDGHVFQDDIAALARAGITSGCSRTRFCPDAAVSRAEMAAFLARAKSLPQTTRATFQDSRRHLHTRAIEAVRRDGITYGCNPPDNTRFCPWLDVTRGEMASFLRRALRR